MNIYFTVNEPIQPVFVDWDEIKQRFPDESSKYYYCQDRRKNEN